MKGKKNELAYIFVVLSNILLIYSSFQASYSDVSLSAIKEKTKVFFLSFDSVVYLVAGLLLMGFTVYLYMHLGAYKVGKLFALYLTFITAGICLVAATNYQYPLGNMLAGVFSFISNLFLFYAIGYITLLTHKRFFRFAAFLLCIVTAVFVIFYAISMDSASIAFIVLRSEMISTDYILVLVITLFCMLKGYRGSTVYSKRQIRFLSVGLLFGVCIFIGMRLMPMLAVVKVPESAAEVSVSYRNEAVGGNQGIYPILAFTGMAIAMLYILIKREYLTIDENRDLRRYLLTSLYLTTGNTYLLLAVPSGRGGYLAFNLLLAAPLILHNHRVTRHGEALYDNNLIDVLEEERQRISILLHDEVLQDLIALSRSIQDEGVKERLSSVIGEIRGVSQDLYPTIVEDLGLEQALRIFIDDIGVDYNIDLHYQYDFPKGILPKGLSLILYRTVKELVTNAVKHSACRKIEVLVSDSSGDIECVVSDDGHGFHMPENMELLKSPHMGLYTVKKQIAGINGNMRIQSDKSGSRFQILVPLRQ